MQLVFASTLFLILVVFSHKSIGSSKRPLNNFIRHFEPLSYDTKDVHKRARRALELSPFANVQIKFDAHNKNFSLHLRRNHDIFAKDFKIVDQNNQPVDYDYSIFFHGDVEGEHGSYCTGVIDEGRFKGKIHVKGNEYHVEPAEKYFKDGEQDFHSIIYSAHDLDYEIKHAHPEMPDRATTLKGSSLDPRTVEALPLEPALTKDHRPEIDGANVPHERQRRGSKNRQKNTCNLKLVADHLFMKKFYSRQTAITEMVMHYNAVEYIFRNQTFNITGVYGSDFWPQGIGFRIKEVHVWSDIENVPADLRPDHISVWRLLELFSEMNHSSVCEAVLFTDRSFDDSVMGLSYVSYPYGQPGGVCDPYAMYGTKMRSYNTAVVTFQLFFREAPPPVTEIALAHELGHALGAQHDPPTSKCMPSDQEGGKYIMYDKATSGFMPNNRAFSECSIISMIKVINAKGLEANVGCFVDRFWAICGNGAWEEGEICDCGTVSTCVEKCCVPYGSPTGIACTLANPAYECSPSRGSCCINSTCTLAREFEKCYDGTDCRKPQFCNGLHYWCPPTEFYPNLTMCDRDRGVCINGYCQGSLCLKYNLEGCLCEQEDKKCHVCCNYNGVCTSAHDIPFMPNRTKSRGTPCNYYKGYCDALGKCVDIDMDGPLRFLYITFFTEDGIRNFFIKYWYVIILGSLLILALLALFVYYCQNFTPSDNPLHAERKPHKPLRRKRKQAAGYGYATGGQAIPMSQTYT